MTSSQKHQRDLLRDIIESIPAIAKGGNAKGLAKETSDDLARQMPQGGSNGGFLIPFAALAPQRERALATNVFSAAGAFVAGEVGTAEHLLRPYVATLAAGAQFIEGLTGNVTIPREATGTTFAWYHETDTVVESTPVFGALNLSPKRVAGACSISTQLDAQTGGILASFLMESLGRGLGAALDVAALSGSGVAGEPLSIFKSSGVNTVTFSGAATHAKSISFIEQAATDNADDSAISWISHPAVRAKWQTLQRFSGVNGTLWNCDSETILSKTARVTTGCPATAIACGDWSKFIFGAWGPQAIRILPDKFSLSLAGKVRFVAEMLCDCGPTIPSAFCVSTDSAVQ